MKTTAATALALISASAGRWTLSPVTGQVRNRPASLAIPSLLYDQFAHHLVVSEPAVLVAENRKIASLGGRDREHVVVTRKGHEVHIERVDRQPVLDVHRGEMDAVGLSLLELQDRIPHPALGHEIDIAPGFRMDDGDPLLFPLFLTRRVLFDERIHLCLELRRRYPI